MAICKKSALLILAGALLAGSRAPVARAAEGDAAPAAKPAPITIQVHGYMQNRFYQGESASPQFRTERVSLSTQAAFPDTSRAHVEVFYHPWQASSGLYLESAYYDTPAGPGRLRVGKGRRITFGITPVYGNRKTSNYGILSETLTQDRTQGVQYLVQPGSLDLGVAVHSGYRLGTRGVGEVRGDALYNATHAVPHLAFRDLPDALSNRLEVSGRVGARLPSGLKGGVSYSYGSVDSRDLTNLTTVVAGNPLAPGGTPVLLPGATGKVRRVVGADLFFQRPSGFVARGEYYDAQVSDLDFNTWNVLGGWEFPSGWRFYAQYAEKNMGLAPTANPLSWDLSQISLSIGQPLHRNVWLQYEYEINRETTHTGGKVDNNVFFVELFSGF